MKAAARIVEFASASVAEVAYNENDMGADSAKKELLPFRFVLGKDALDVVRIAEEGVLKDLEKSVRWNEDLLRE